MTRFFQRTAVVDELKKRKIPVVGVMNKYPRKKNWNLGQSRGTLLKRTADYGECQNRGGNGSLKAGDDSGSAGGL